MNNSKKKIIIVASLAAAMGAIATGVLAYLTDTKEVNNTLTIGNVAIELTEPSFVAADYTAICPEQEILKDPTVKNVGNSPAYIKLDVFIPTNTDGFQIVTDENTLGTTNELFTYQINEGWTAYGNSEQVEVEEDGNPVTYTKYSYTYNEALEPNDSTAALFNSIKLANITDGQAINGETVNIPITAYGIQSEGLDLDTAFEKYDEQEALTKE